MSATIVDDTQAVVVDHVAKRFPPARGRTEAAAVLSDVCLAVQREEILTILGPSGCGKTTLLNCIAGLETYDGRIMVHGREVREPGSDVSVVFQAPHLLPWRTVEENARYGLELGRVVPKSEWGDRVSAALELVGLAEVKGLYPRQLSGGMQQRVNIARALAVGPRLLLMDEPFGALDAITKERMQEELQRIVAREKVSVIFITHDIGEAIFLGDRVAVMGSNPGRLKLLQYVDMPRPRELAFKRSGAFQDLYSRLWDTL